MGFVSLFLCQHNALWQKHSVQKGHFIIGQETRRVESLALESQGFLQYHGASDLKTHYIHLITGLPAPTQCQAEYQTFNIWGFAEWHLWCDLILGEIWVKNLLTHDLEPTTDQSTNRTND